MTGASARVRAAMNDALARPPAMERDEDPDERRLTQELAAELGCEAALLFPTCTMANQAALRVALPEGGIVPAAPTAHLVTVEAAATALARAVPLSLAAERGHPTPDAVADHLAGRAADAAPTLVWLENTFMLAGGSLMPEGWNTQIAGLCARYGARVHLDGSRLWNAAAATGRTLGELAEGADTVALSLNKALGAPLGAVLAGTREIIDQAARTRAALGGEWRPLGGVAAAALAAREGWRERLKRDHAVARAVASGLAARLGQAGVPAPETNLVFIHLPPGRAIGVTAMARERGVLVLPLGRGPIRLAFHAGVTLEDAPFVVEVLAQAVAGVSAAEAAE